MRHLRLLITCCLLLGLFVVGVAAQDTATPNAPTFTPTATLPTLTPTNTQLPMPPTAAALGIGVTRFDANVWADPLIISNLPASSLPAGLEVALLAIHPTGQWYKINSQDNIYWIEVYALDIISPQIVLDVERDISPTPAPFEPSATSTRAPLLPTSTMPSSVLIPFGYGGEVLTLNTEAEYIEGNANTWREKTFDAMRQAGMSWLKVNIAFTPRIDTQEAGNAIEAAHQAGFKLLLTITGDGAQMAYGGDDYFTDYLSFVGQVAALNPDAIEIWAAPNRNWTPDGIHGATYVEKMLRPAYTAIKTANPFIIVISGALQPIEVNEANEQQPYEDVFLSQMMDAGANRSMDCLGMHYDGAVAPDAVQGDPRDGRYVRFLTPMIDRLHEEVNQFLPICITSLGYLQTEDNPQLQDAYRWAYNTTRVRQTTWHIAAWQYVRNRSAVRLLIIHTIDSALFETDIPSGYSIMQPDGTCPLCETWEETLYLEKLPKATIQRTTNIRAGASIDFNPPIGAFDMGVQVIILGVHPSGEWYHVREVTQAQEAREGWIRAEDVGTSFTAALSLVPTEAGPPPPAVTITPQLRPTATPTSVPGQ